jgi:hypothetical protein
MTSDALPHLIECRAGCILHRPSADRAHRSLRPPIFSGRQSAQFDDSSRTENHVVAKLILPADALPGIARALLADAAEIPELQLAFVPARTLS